MKFRDRETRHTRQVSVDIPINSKEEEFVGLLDVNNSPTQIKPLIEDAWKGLKTGRSPELCEEGVGGTYFMRDPQNRKIAVFKPQDEEPFNINNPKGYRPRRGSDAGFKEGILVGEASIRECVAYLLDHERFASVPVTDLVLCQHPAFHCGHKSAEEKPSKIEEFNLIDYIEESLRSPRQSFHSCKIKIGSFQEFVQHDGNCEDISRSLLAKFPADEVHKIAQLDIRMINADRHGGNILYREVEDEIGEPAYMLIPIDHGYALPSTLDEAWFEWLSWPQAKVKMSEKTLEYIKNLDVDKEIEMLKEKFGGTIRDEHYRVLRIGTMLLQKGAAAGLTFYQIGCVVCRLNLKEPSVLELMVAKASSKVLKELEKPDDAAFLSCLGSVMDEEIAHISNQVAGDDTRGIAPKDPSV